MGFFGQGAEEPSQRVARKEEEPTWAGVPELSHLVQKSRFILDH